MRANPILIIVFDGLIGEYKIEDNQTNLYFR